MSCQPQIPHEDPDTSDYGSDFTPDEEELLNDLFTKAVAERGPAESDATPVSSQTNTLTPAATPRATPIPAIARIPIASVELPDTNSSQAPVFASFVADIEDGIAEPPSTRLPKVLGREKLRSPWRGPSQQPWKEIGSARTGLAFGTNQGANNSPATAFVEHQNSTEGRERERERVAAREQEWIQHEQLAPTLDARSPIERFRRPPNKAFSVTDLVSPAWCELQYWYTLTKHGRKRRTLAMKKGSVVHKTLEDEIYTTVPVEITTKEDAWALRIWNVIQGLRMLRQYGITRELEIWGVVDGEVVNGVIDQLSYECPDSKLEATAAEFYQDAVASRAALPEYQMSLSDFLLSSSQGGRRLSDLGQTESMNIDAAMNADRGPSPAVYNLPRIYMTDVKTRGSRSIPTVKSTSFRPTSLQLQLYYHMLNRLLTSDEVTMDLLAARYNLDPERPFTDAFISEVGGLNDEFFDALSAQEFDIDDPPTPEDARKIPNTYNSPISSSPPQASQDSTSILSTHGTLSKLWSLMKEQLRDTFIPSIPGNQSIAPSIPHHTQPEILQHYSTLLSPVLTARFLSSAPTEDPEDRHIGSRSFLFDPNNLSSYLTEQMEWWRGHRDPRGVNISEAWKCRVCEFRDECTWRQEREWAYARRNEVRRKSASADI
ncbi:hypothetical protein N7478_000442 [Penicillium angulare]|uniref:uncharacterized protein n=1 Tax=Penicillium angulare TaxID=116970 RepID=UPI0025418AA9|nr:uncharacterized protein N7478_000442 [Penicillium angulare]KAJ5291191.1 hypothetical protein N7478_000442 [Penicillium angulare]